LNLVETFGYVGYVAILQNSITKSSHRAPTETISGFPDSYGPNMPNG